jgi:hypothetical protein
VDPVGAAGARRHQAAKLSGLRSPAPPIESVVKSCMESQGLLIFCHMHHRPTACSGHAKSMLSATNHTCSEGKDAIFTR